MNANRLRQTAIGWLPARRQFLKGGAGVLAASTAGLLIACVSDSNKNEEARATAAPSGTRGTTAAGATTPAPKRGGRFLSVVGISTTNLNPITNWNKGTILSGVAVYDRLISTQLGKDSAKEYVPEAAQSVEQPDPQTVIFKLKPGMKYQDRAPVSGRAVAADDIVQSEAYVRDNPGSQDKSFQTNSMQSVEAPDAQIVVFKLKVPNAYLFSGTQMGYPVGGSIIVPKETLDTLDQGW